MLVLPDLSFLSAHLLLRQRLRDHRGTNTCCADVGTGNDNVGDICDSVMVDEFDALILYFRLYQAKLT